MTGPDVPEFESFRRELLPLKAPPHLTIQRRGSISLNRSAFVALGTPDAVELLYDQRRRIIGLRPIDRKADNAHIVRRASPSVSGPWVISALAFTRFYDIDTSHSLRWPAYLDHGVLCTDISADGVPVTSNRAHRPH